MKVSEAMTSDAKWIGPDVTLQEAARQMREQDIGSLPVGENDRLIGMVTDRDICCRAVADGRDPTTTTVRDVLSQKISYCFDDEDLSEAAHRMEERHIRRLAVLNRDKRFVGILTVGDIARHGQEALAGEVIEEARAHA